MLRKVKEFFQAETTLEIDSEGNSTNTELQMAVGTLLLEASAADGDLGPEELAIIVRTMQKVFSLEEATAIDLLDTANSLREDKKKVDELVDAVNKHFNLKQRLVVLAMIWKVVVTDGCIKGFESRYVVSIANRLQLSEHQVEAARSMALGGKV